MVKLLRNSNQTKLYFLLSRNALCAKKWGTIVLWVYQLLEMRFFWPGGYRAWVSFLVFLFLFIPFDTCTWMCIFYNDSMMTFQLIHESNASGVVVFTCGWDDNAQVCQSLAIIASWMYLFRIHSLILATPALV